VAILTAYPEKYSLHAHHYIDKDLVFFANKAQFLYYLPKIIARFEKMHAEKEIVNRIHQLSKNEIRTFPKMINNASILLSDILFITVIGHNIVLKMNSGEEIIDRMTLRELIDFLPANTFLQIKRNTIINIIYVTAFTDTTVCLEDQHFRISTRRQKEIVQILKTEISKLYENY
jgi:DNA-binding LytR/AlgR family response regulator